MTDTKPTHSRDRSSSFGEFLSASNSSTSVNKLAEPLGAGDLLGSFEDLDDAMSTPMVANKMLTSEAKQRTEQRQKDLLGGIEDLITDENGQIKPQKNNPHLQPYLGEDAIIPTGNNGHHFVSDMNFMNPFHTTSTTSSSSSRPPLPLPFRSPAPPRRMSEVQSFAGPSSPPSISPDPGNSFIFRARAGSQEVDSPTGISGGGGGENQKHIENAEEGMRRLSISPTRNSFNIFLPSGSVGHFPKRRPSLDKKSVSPSKSSSSGHRKARTDMPGRYRDDEDAEEDDGGVSGSYSAHANNNNNINSGIEGFNTLASTLSSKAAKGIKSKWKTVVGPSSFHPPTRSSTFSTSIPGPGLHGFSQSELDAPSATAQYISTSHHTPFSTSTWSSSGSGSGSGYRNGNGIGNGRGSFSEFTSASPAGYVPPDGAPGFGGESGDGSGSGYVEQRDYTGTKLDGRRETTMKVLDEAAVDSLRPSLTARQRLSNTWTLLFSLDQHGASLSTFYRLIETYSTKKPQAGNILVIRDSHNRRFGVYMNDWIRRAEGIYTGSGESWLFKLYGQGPDVRAKIFKWTGKNHYFSLCESGFISFGGGDGKYGLFLEAAFVDGSSARCPAYDNEVLCEPEGSTLEGSKFECVGLEVWGT